MKSNNKEFKEKLLLELKSLKDSLVHVIKNKDEIIKEYGSVSNFYKNNLKIGFKTKFPLINKFISLRKDAFIKYDGDIDRFYIELFNSTKNKAIELYGTLGIAIMNAPIDYLSKKELEEEENNINTFIKYVDKMGYTKSFIELYDIGNKYYDYLENTNYKNDNYKKRKISREEVVLYARKTIESIDPSLLELFDNFTKNDSIKFYNIKTMNSTSSYLRRQKKKLPYVEYKIKIYRENNFNDVCTLVHEFMHHITGYNVDSDDKYYYYSKEYIIKKKYTEFISIYFEMYAKDYLINRFNIPKEEFDPFFRIDNKTNAKRYRRMYLPFKIYKIYGKYNFENYQKFISDYDINQNPNFNGYEKSLRDFETMFKVGIKPVIKQEIVNKEHPNLINKRELENTLSLLFDYFIFEDNYIFGTLLAFDIKDKTTPKEILYLSKLLNTNDKIKIFLDPTFKKIDNMYEAIKTKDDPFRKMNDELSQTNRGVSI